MASRYHEVYEGWKQNPEKFWSEAAEAIDWITPPATALDDSAPPLYRWYPGATLNTSVNALDRHVAAGRGDQPALIWDSA
ncbi:MAG: propionyl-CoA synthetase, partial [Hyphomicrobiales bacterium]|nr:propionyl-CoA synthetase [Hyphomicrobiales bacterium]